MTQEYPELNAAAQQNDPDSVLNFYKNLIAFRQKGPYQDCLIYGDIEPLESSSDVIAYRRSTGETVLDCWFNLGGTTVEERLPQPAAEQVWHTQKGVDIQNGTLRLAPWQSVILKSNTKNGGK